MQVRVDQAASERPAVSSRNTSFFPALGADPLDNSLCSTDSRCSHVLTPRQHVKQRPMVCGRFRRAALAWTTLLTLASVGVMK